MIKKIIQTSTVAFAIFSGISLAATAASAQTTTGYGNTSSTTAASTSAPVLYNQSGAVVNGYNSSTGTLNPGWYYNASGQPVYYYSNGTYYNESTGQYGGTAYYSNGTGTSGVAPAYTAPYVAPTTVTTTTGSGNTSGTMETLYNSSGQPVNTTSGVTLPAGTYYTANGQSVYYYGNGTYYDAASDTYGGSVNDPTGLAGTYYYNSTTATNPVSYITPGVPDTGAGGNALYTWLMLIASGAVFAGGAGYLTKVSFR